MKTLYLSFFMSFTMLAFAQQPETYSEIPLPKIHDSQFSSAVKTAIDLMDKAVETAQMQQAATTFSQLADKYPTEWLAPYYAAYSYTLLSFLEKNISLKDEYLGQGQAMLDRAKALSPNNAEILVAQTYLYQMRVQVDPSNRAASYGTLAQLALEDAEKLDVNNPRIYYLRAQNLFLSPESAGGGLAKACFVAKIALQKYQNYPAKSEIAPKWGEAMTNYMATVCQDLNK